MYTVQAGVQYFSITFMVGGRNDPHLKLVGLQLKFNQFS